MRALPPGLPATLCNDLRLRGIAPGDLADGWMGAADTGQPEAQAPADRSVGCMRECVSKRNTLPGVLDDALLADWCLRYLGAPFERVLFRSGYLSDVVGVELSSGLRAVVKARPFQPRIVGCLQVQAALARVGFPCPEPLTVATRVHGMTVTAETEVPGGRPLPTEAGTAPSRPSSLA